MVNLSDMLAFSLKMVAIREEVNADSRRDACGDHASGKKSNDGKQPRAAAIA